MSITLDGNLYDWKMGSYQVVLARLGESKPTANGGHARTDNGSWKKTFNLTLLADNVTIGTTTSVPGGAKTVRNNLRATYAKNTPISFTTMDGDTYSVYFNDSITERLRFDVDTTGNGYEYEMDIVLIEA